MTHQVESNFEDQRPCQPGLVNWHPTLEAACTQAAQTGKLVLVFQMLGRLDQEYCCAAARLARKVIFVDPQVVDYIHQNFEPVWVSLRPAPIVRIDFKNGHTITRPVQGKVATTICAPDSGVLDMLPGMYAPQGYLSQLKTFKILSGIAPLPPPERAKQLTEYHNLLIIAAANTERARLRSLAAAGSSLEAQAQAPRSVESLLDTWKTQSAKSQTAPPEALSAEKLVASRLLDLAKSSQAEQAPGEYNSELIEATSGLTADETAQWQALVEETAAQEGTRRQAIHRRLAGGEFLLPGVLVKWLYRDVLMSDLDDPYLGFGKI